jgi:hypothetical protein
MFKLHLFFKKNKMEWIKSYNWFQTFCTTKTCNFYKSTHSLDELDEKPNYTKNPKSWNFEGKNSKENDLFFKPLNKKIMFNGFKISSLRCRSHVWEISLPKNMFVYPLKFTLGISRKFWVSSYKPKYLYIIMYECENSPPPHELF